MLIPILAINNNMQHPCDEWNMYANIVQIHQHKDMEERRDAAILYKEMSDTHVEIVLDNIDNEACNGFTAMPDRLYVIQNSKIVYKGGMGPEDYKPDEIMEFLEFHKLKQNSGLFRNLVIGSIMIVSSYILFNRMKRK